MIVNNEDIYKVTKEIDKAFQGKKIKGKILVPEAAHIKYLYKKTHEFAKQSSDQIKAFWQKGSATSLRDM